MLLGEKLSIPFDLYINSATKTTVLFEVRNIEGQNHSEHTVTLKVIKDTFELDFFFGRTLFENGY